MQKKDKHRKEDKTMSEEIKKEAQDAEINPEDLKTRLPGADL